MSSQAGRRVRRPTDDRPGSTRAGVLPLLVAGLAGEIAAARRAAPPGPVLPRSSAGLGVNGLRLDELHGLDELRLAGLGVDELRLNELRRYYRSSARRLVEPARRG